MTDPIDKYMQEYRNTPEYEKYILRGLWHYPSKGELPPKGEQVLCRLWNGNNVLAFKREDDEWTTNGRFTFDGVKCWQYIVPPKEEA